MKKIYFLTLALICAIAANAANIPSGTKLYLTPNSNWKIDNARFAAYFFGDGEAWASMTAVSGETDLYEVTTPGTGKNFTNVIFCRMNPSASANNWNNKWNQTADLVYDGANNWCTINAGQWDCGTNVTWSFYGVTENVELGLSWQPNTIYPGDIVTINASVIGNPEGSIIKIDVNGEVTEGTTATWTAGEAGTYTVKATCFSSTNEELASTEDIITVTAVTSQFTVYLEKKSTSWTNVNVYSWVNETNPSGAWPGTAMNVTNVSGDDYYYYTFRNVSNVNIIFNNGSEQTVDINNVTKDTYYVLSTKNGEGKYTVLTYDVPTGVEENLVDDVAVEYYNLQGVKVANPVGGIFIKKQGAKTTKVVL